jgi:hypothetical protein
VVAGDRDESVSLPFKNDIEAGIDAELPHIPGMGAVKPRKVFSVSGSGAAKEWVG